MAVQNLTTKSRRRSTSRRIERRNARSSTRQTAADLAAVRAHLDDLQRGLKLVMSVVIVAVEALNAQNADHDVEVALVLRRHAGDRLYGHIEEIHTLLRRLIPKVG